MDRTTEPGDEPDTIYTTILTATYDEEEEAAETAIQYSTELPARPPANLVFEHYPLQALAAELHQEHKITAFKPYADSPDLALDEALEEYAAERDTDVTHWMLWLEDTGYNEFVRTLKDTVTEEGEVYLLASKDTLPETTIRDEAAAYAQELYQDRQRQAERNQSGFHRRSF